MKYILIHPDSDYEKVKTCVYKHFEDDEIEFHIIPHNDLNMFALMFGFRNDKTFWDSNYVYILDQVAWDNCFGKEELKLTLK